VAMVKHHSTAPLLQAPSELGNEFVLAWAQVKGSLRQLMGSVHSSVTAACDEYFDR